LRKADWHIGVARGEGVETRAIEYATKGLGEETGKTRTQDLNALGVDRAAGDYQAELNSLDHKDDAL
jgi:hypothetical protein